MARRQRGLEQYNSGKDLLARARRSENYAGERVEGSHHIVFSKRGGQVVIPVHGNKDLAKGTRAAIIKRMIAIGLALLALGLLLMAVMGGL